MLYAIAMFSCWWKGQQPSATSTPARPVSARVDMTPAISVVLPVHNRADVLGRAIQSVLDQKLEAFELIIVDDGSTDDSVSIARSFDDAQIQIIELGQNRGGNVARNTGVRAAKATLIAFLDSDDTYLPEKLEVVAAEFGTRRRWSCSSTAS